jgi:biopolymer transport protein ExbB
MAASKRVSIRHLYWATLAAFAASPAFAQAGVDPETLPHDLSALGMFLQADWIVKGVMIVLALASFATWAILMAKSWELRAAISAQRRMRAQVDAARTLGEAAVTSGSSTPRLVEAARDELALSADALGDREGLRERIASRLEQIEAEATRGMRRGTGLLATIGAVAPFVGLFGTVWGIMNAFIGISAAQTTNLAVVAPGIAEALLATALGLVAAIPAVVIYNHFTRRIAAWRGMLAATSAGVLRLVSRDLSRGMAGDTLRAAE